MESESDKEANAVCKLSLGDILNWKQTEMETCVQVVYWGRISKGVRETGWQREKCKCIAVATEEASADPIGALELGWTFRIVSK